MVSPIFGLKSNFKAVTGTRRADLGGVQSKRELLSIRAILVGTRAAVQSHRRAGRPELIRSTAERGLALMDELVAVLRPDAEDQVRQAAAHARAEIAAIVQGARGETLSPRG